MAGKINNEDYRALNTALHAQLTAENLIDPLNDLMRLAPYGDEIEGLIWCRKFIAKVANDVTAIYERAAAQMTTCGHDMGALTDKMYREEMKNIMTTNPRATYAMYQVEKALGISHAIPFDDDELIAELEKEDNEEVVVRMLKKDKTSNVEKLMRKLGLCDDDDEDDDDEDTIPCVVTEDDGTESEYTIRD